MKIGSVGNSFQKFVKRKRERRDMGLREEFAYFG